jgi:hypothetical protein
MLKLEVSKVVSGNNFVSMEAIRLSLNLKNINRNRCGDWISYNCSICGEKDTISSFAESLNPFYQCFKCACQNDEIFMKNKIFGRIW